MRCSDVQDQLSAYYDDELSESAREELAQHLDECGQCAAAIAEFDSVTLAMSRLPQPGVPLAVWNGISAELDALELDKSRGQYLVRPEPKTVQLRRPWSPLQRLVLAASVLFLLGSGVWMTSHTIFFSHTHHEHSADFVMTMDEYLQTLEVDPAAAERFLLDKYDGQTVDPEDAVKLVGYRPAVAEGLPEGYSLASTSVLVMPCCTCVKSVCKRGDGSTLVLFEHDDGKTEWFGQRPTSMATCGDKECCLVELDSSIAATWKRGSRSVTAVGVRNIAEVTTLVGWLDHNADEKS